MSTTETAVALRTWSHLGGLPVRAAVTTRAGGVSRGPYASLNLGLHVGDDAQAVVENRRRAAAGLGLALDDLVFANQVHGRGVVAVDGGHRGRGARAVADAVGDADALVTATPGVGLVVLVADCVPLVLYAPDVHAVAVVHAGWRGTVADVVGAAVDRLASMGAARSRLLAGIGPAIAADDYEIGPEVVAAVRSAFGAGTEDLLTPGRRGRGHLDLWAANRRRLVAAGVDEGRIELLAEPTGETTPFFSDRAARPCGRFAVLAVLEPRP